MRTTGWLGHPPATDDEARARILEATHRCVERRGARTTISDVASSLGLSRATVYRYYEGTATLLQAAAVEGTREFLDQLGDHLRSFDDLAEAAVEGVTFIITQVPSQPYLQLMFEESTHTLLRTVTSETTRAIARALLVERTSVDWTRTTIDSSTLDELVEWIQRIVQSFLSDQTESPTRTPDQLREYLHRWLGPSIRTWATVADNAPSRSAPETAPAATP
ncbi:TetR/AcrR family transcriptional regulator [Nocardia alba]|uniref:TetR family transcriptional regulator n=1 Tax=Nocardia alba TaxID=225051 RepID=A0A4R1FSM1_9NOCA|nr:TetR/AcrR family transcriptional regulator [Nocardia alba]TCJ96634.1 TetR family transcriptional regulator [Nocardia alba]